MLTTINVIIASITVAVAVATPNQESQEGKNPLEGFAPAVPSGHELQLILTLTLTLNPNPVPDPNPNAKQP